MALKDKLKVFRLDHLSHYQWASWFATVICLVAVGAAYFKGLPTWQVCAAGAGASLATSTLAGLAGEYSDSRDPEHHEVSAADAYASMLGGLPSALPLAFLALLLFYFGR